MEAERRRYVSMHKITVFISFFAALVCSSAVLAASDAVIRGEVSDSAGKPIRGAMVKATAGNKTVTRFSQKDGRYEIPLASGKYNVSAEAFGFAVGNQTKDAAEAGETNFKLSPKMDVTHLTGAELVSLLPDNTETRSLQANCIGCHTFRTILMRRGSTSAWFQKYLPTMTNNVGRVADWPSGKAILVKNFTQIPFTPEAIVTISNLVEKYFGPNAPDFGPHAAPPAKERVQHAELSDGALRGTFQEYTIPTPKPMVHSMMVDSARGTAWFGEQSRFANKIGRFDMKTETFQEYRVPSEGAAPHTGVVDKDGVLWIALAGLSPGTIASVDPKTGKVTEYPFSEKKLSPYAPGAHTVSFDRAGNLLISQLGDPEVWTFDTKKHHYQAYKYPANAKYSEDSIGAWGRVAGQPQEVPRAAPYHVVTDSKGIMWFTEDTLGKLVSLDPATGKTKEYKPPGTINTKGVVVDAQDNIWYTNFLGHKLAKLDQKTGAIKEFRPPTQNATFYGVTIDKKTGYLWAADTNGNHITRFDPKTEQFVEYPIPSADAYPRFIDVDENTGKIWFTEFFNGKIGALDPGDGSKQMASTR
jgi:streptogramin lyase